MNNPDLQAWLKENEYSIQTLFTLLERGETNEFSFYIKAYFDLEPEKFELILFCLTNPLLELMRKTVEDFELTQKELDSVFNESFRALDNAEKYLDLVLEKVRLTKNLKRLENMTNYIHIAKSEYELNRQEEASKEFLKDNNNNGQ